MPHRYHRFAILADPRLGFASFSWRVKEALEREGHCAFWFSPDRWPQLFENGVCRLDALEALIERWNIDCVLVADGLGVACACPQKAPCALCLVAEETEDARSSLSRSNQGGGVRFDAAICFGQDACDAVDAHGVRSLRIDGFRDDSLFGVQLANELACRPGIACFDRDTHQALLEASEMQAADATVYCLTKNAPGLDTSHYGAMHVLRDALAIVEPTESKLTAYQGFLAEGFGLPVCRFEDAPQYAQTAAPGRKREQVVPVQAPSLAEQVMPFLESAMPGFGALGYPTPARFVCALGYFGCGNFGDEFIQSTVAARVADRCENTVTVAVGENPWYTLVNRGIYEITLRDKFALNEILKRASASLVCAGLLFDQGIRWTMGHAELLSSVAHTDIPGIAAFVELGHLNGVRTYFYGIGAGPLKNPDSQRLVKLCGTFGSEFFARDAHTAELIAACGVPSEQVHVRADAAFTSNQVGTDHAKQWLEGQGIDSDSRDLVAVSLRNYENVDDLFPDRIASALDIVAKRRPFAELIFCILDQDDEVISRHVIDRMAERERCIIFNSHDDIDLMASMLESVSCGLSMRYHCSLLINRAGHPCVGIGYLPKVEALYHEVGCSDRLLLGMDASAEELAAALSSTFSERDAYACKIRAGVGRLTALARQSEDDLAAAIDAAGVRSVVDEPVFFTYENDSERRLKRSTLERGWVEDRLRDTENRLHDVENHLHDAQNQLDGARARIAELENSNSYRVGSVLMKVPGWFKHRLFHK